MNTIFPKKILMMLRYGVLWLFTITISIVYDRCNGNSILFHKFLIDNNFIFVRQNNSVLVKFSGT